MIHGPWIMNEMVHSQDEGCINRHVFYQIKRYKYLKAKCVIGELIVNMVGSPDGIADASV